MAMVMVMTTGMADLRLDFAQGMEESIKMPNIVDEVANDSDESTVSASEMNDTDCTDEEEVAFGFVEQSESSPMSSSGRSSSPEPQESPEVLPSRSPRTQVTATHL